MNKAQYNRLNDLMKQVPSSIVYWVIKNKDLDIYQKRVLNYILTRTLSVGKNTAEISDDMVADDLGIPRSYARKAFKHLHDLALIEQYFLDGVRTVAVFKHLYKDGAVVKVRSELDLLVYWAVI